MNFAHFIILTFPVPFYSNLKWIVHHRCPHHKRKQNNKQTNETATTSHEPRPTTHVLVINGNDESFSSSYSRASILVQVLYKL